MAENKGDEPVDPLKVIWRGEQRTPRIGVEGLRAEAARRRRKMLLVVAGEVVLTVGLIALTVTIVRAEGPTSSGTVTWLMALWLTWVIAAGFATWNRWGVWQPETETALSYLALLEERARRRGRVTVFVLGLIAVQAVIPLVMGEAGVSGLALVALYAGWAVWYGRKARRELEDIRHIAAEFRDEDGKV